MVLNKYEQEHKKFLALKRALDENYITQKNLGYTKLEKPIRSGWKVSLIPRIDIQRREDADVFWKILASAGFSIITSSKKKYYKEAKLHSNFNARILKISKAKYDSFEPALQKHFTQCTLRKHWNEDYYCNIPNFYWELKFTKHYITEVKIIDELLLQEEAELKVQVFGKKYASYQEGRNPPADYVNTFNRKFRARSKQTLYNKINKDIDDVYELSGRHTARWMWW